MSNKQLSSVCSLEISPGGGFGLSVWDKDYLKTRVAFFTPGVHAMGYETFDPTEIVNYADVASTASKRKYPYVALTQTEAKAEYDLRKNGYSLVHPGVAGGQIIYRLNDHVDAEYHTFRHDNTERPASEWRPF
jgi:hypothetical protein